MAEHATTGDAINHAIDKASDGLAQIAHALSGAAPQAWALAVKGVYAQGASQLIVGGVFIVCSILCAIIAVPLLLRANKTDSEFCGVVGVVLCLVAAVLLFVSAINIADASAWARVISPDGYLAQQVLSKAL